MKVDRLTPILNVSDLKRTFEWFEKLGWQKAWDWGIPAREMHVRHPDGHVFRVSQGIEVTK
jgi:hypothetical protein